MTRSNRIAAAAFLTLAMLASFGWTNGVPITPIQSSFQSEIVFESLDALDSVLTETNTLFAHPIPREGEWPQEGRFASHKVKEGEPFRIFPLDTEFHLVVSNETEHGAWTTIPFSRAGKRPERIRATLVKGDVEPNGSFYPPSENTLVIKITEAKAILPSEYPHFILDDLDPTHRKAVLLAIPIVFGLGLCSVLFIRRRGPTNTVEPTPDA